MAEQNRNDWKQNLDQAVLQAKAEVIGSSKIKEVQHALLVITALKAFGDDPKATFYIEGLAPTGSIPRPDLILLHPLIGVLVIENKGIKLSDIHAVNNTELTILRDGRLKKEDPFHQAERVMFRLRDLAGSRINLSEALFLQTTALPRIGREEFEQQFQTRWPDQTLFAEECSDPQKFKNHLLGFAEHLQRSAKRTSRLSRRSRDAILTILSGRGFLFAPRKTYLEGADPKSLGMQIQEMELAMKEATQQQRELGRADLRGHHRLFRGVAGSGKSIMLALSVAQTLHNFCEEEGLFGNSSPKRKVLACCFNKTLVHYLRQRIDDRFGRLAWDKPNGESLLVIHFEGMIRRLVTDAPALDTKLTFKEKAERAKRMLTALEALQPKVRDSLLFDAVYVDEAQDLEPEEIKLLLALSRKDENGGQTFVLFYDNAQNIYGVVPPIWGELGVNIVGRTEFLDTCLRNTKEQLTLAFNVLIGSFAQEGQRVHTRRFADVQSLRQRGLVEEKDGRFEIGFAPRSGSAPEVRVYANRQAEIDLTVAAIRKLVIEQKVIPSDILILYSSHWAFKDQLETKLERSLGQACRLRLVDKEHDANKKLPLLEDGVMTISTIASAKGYDAPIVFLLGADELGTDEQDRATFYVGATRAKLHLIVSGVNKAGTTLFSEIVETAKAVGSAVIIDVPTPVAPVAVAADTERTRISKVSQPPKVVEAKVINAPKARCRHCGRERLHAQHGKFGYFYRCIDCTEITPIDATCPRCQKKGRIRKAANDFFRECEECKFSVIFHTNIPLNQLDVESS